MVNPIQVLHVDDEPGLLDVSTELLEREDERFEVLTATSTTEGIDIISERDVDCVVSDYDMPDSTGLDLLRSVREDHETLPFILFTGKGSEEVASEAFSAGATDYLQKETATDQFKVLANRVVNAVEKHRSQEELAERTRRMETLISNLPGMVYRCKNQRGWPMEYVDGEVEELTGYTASSLENNEVVWGEEILHPDDREPMWEAVQEALEGDGSFEVTYRIISKDGDLRWMWERGRGIYDEDGELEALEGFITEITERVERENELRELKIFNEQLVEELPVGLLHLDEELRITYENPKAEEIMGVPEDEDESAAIGEDVRDLPSIIAAEKSEKAERLAEGESIDIEFEFESIYGEESDLSGQGVPLFDDDEFDGALVILEDITERKERQRELERYETIVETTGDPVYTLDEDGNFTFVNDAFTEFTGYSMDDLIGEHASVVMDESDVEKGREAIESLLSSSDNKGTFELSLRTSSGEKIPCENHVGLLPFEDEFQGTVGVLRDISERKERIRNLEEEREKYSTLVEQSHDGVVIVQDKEYTFVNPVMEELTGRSEDELLGLPFYEIMAPEYQELVKERYEKRVKGENPPQSYDIEIVTKSGKRRHIDLQVSSIQYRGEPATLATFKDITERKEYEQELEEYRDLVEKIPVGIYRTTGGEEGEFIEANPRFMEILGVESRDDLYEYSPSDFYVDPERRTQFVQKLEQTGYVEGFEIEYEALDGTTGWLESTSIRHERDDGKVFFDGVIQDVTEQKRRERELERYETLVETMSDAVYALDTEGRYTYVNSYMEEVTGYDREELIGKQAPVMMPEETVEKFEEGIREMLRGERETVTVEFEIQPPEKDPYPVEVRSTLLMVDGEFQGTVGVSRDISERKRRERELQRQNKRLDEFASIVSHDLRNPLNVAQARLELAREECDSDHLDHVAESHSRMWELIENLLKLAREGESVSEMDEVNLAKITEICWQNVDTEKAELSTETDSVIRADRNRLQQLIENLIRNSVEHSSPSNQPQSDDSVEQNGGLKITVGDLDNKDGFYFEDNGDGIPGDKRKQVFESGYSTSDEGSGFGLTIVERIVEAHGWNVRITESAEGGARFEISGVEFT